MQAVYRSATQPVQAKVTDVLEGLCKSSTAAWALANHLDSRGMGNAVYYRLGEQAARDCRDKANNLMSTFRTGLQSTDYSQALRAVITELKNFRNHAAQQACRSVAMGRRVNFKKYNEYQEELYNTALSQCSTCLDQLGFIEVNLSIDH